MHVDDAAWLYYQAVRHATAGSIYHGANGAVTARQMAEAIAAKHHLGTKSISKAEAAEIYGPFFSMIFSLNNEVDSSKAQRELQWQPQHGIDHFLDALAGKLV